MPTIAVGYPCRPACPGVGGWLSGGRTAAGVGAAVEVYGSEGGAEAVGQSGLKWLEGAGVYPCLAQGDVRESARTNWRLPHSHTLRGAS